ncbi:hypothetical protein ACH427_31765 [Streptomyces sp. NPDC020379]|uniref:hypothetical protein n=1 Tax=Streptomyces sp. NPDC020379 TaxID=3365071 RepID=UPI0037877969
MGDAYEKMREELDRVPSAEELKLREEAARIARESEGKPKKGPYGPIGLIPLPDLMDDMDDEKK